MGGRGNRETEFGGRPKSDANYGPKRRFDSKPRHDDRGGHGGGRFDDRPKRDVELFDATCTTCGKSCSVPFRPNGEKPVLCKECFANKNASPEATFGKGDRQKFDRPSTPRTDFTRPQNSPGKQLDIAGLQRQMSSLDAKLNEVVQMIRGLEGKLQTAAPKKEVVKVAEKKTEKKAEKPKEKPVAKVKEVKPKKVVKKAVKK